jgi:hypothetical protein
MYLVKFKFQARIRGAGVSPMAIKTHEQDAQATTKKRAGQKCPAVFSKYFGNDYGAAFVVGGVVGAAFVDGVDGVELLSLLQPLTTALKARPNSTTKDSFFIGRRNLSCFPKKHK